MMFGFSRSFQTLRISSVDFIIPWEVNWSLTVSNPWGFALMTRTLVKIWNAFCDVDESYVFGCTPGSMGTNPVFMRRGICRSI